jgi:Spy/CpxP family protein refolding chaperone
MKRIWIWSGVAVVLIVAVVAIRAQTRGWHCGHLHRGAWGPAGFLAHELDLSDAQRKQIGVLWDAERPRVAGLVRELAAENAELRGAGKEKNDAKVLEIASRQGITISKLLVEKETLCAKISDSVLNEEQKKKADKLESSLNEKLESLASRLEKGGSHEN